MVPALSMEEMLEEILRKYEYGEQRIVGIMLARYDVSLVQNVISECYRYWHKYTGRDFDIFWPGYGAYIPMDHKNESIQILNFFKNNDRVYFDLDAFVSFKKIIKKEYLIPYSDHFEILLVNYRDGKLHFNEYIKVNLEKNINLYNESIRDIIEFIIDESRALPSVVELNKKIKTKKIWESIKDIKTSDVVSLASALL